MTTTQPNVSAEIAQEVAKQLGASTSLVKERVINTLVESEIVRRATVLSEALTKVKELQRTLQKTQPDQKTYDAAGNESAVFSEAKFKERKKTTESLEALEKALEVAMSGTTPDGFNKLKEALQKTGAQGKEG